MKTPQQIKNEVEKEEVLKQMDLYLEELKKALERNDYGFAELLNMNFGKYLEKLQ